MVKTIDNVLSPGLGAWIMKFETDRISLDFFPVQPIMDPIPDLDGIPILVLNQNYFLFVKLLFYQISIRLSVICTRLLVSHKLDILNHNFLDFVLRILAAKNRF